MNETLYEYLYDRLYILINILGGNCDRLPRYMTEFLLRKDIIFDYINLSEDNTPRPRIIKLYKEVTIFNPIII